MSQRRLLSFYLYKCSQQTYTCCADLHSQSANYSVAHSNINLSLRGLQYGPIRAYEMGVQSDYSAADFIIKLIATQRIGCKTLHSGKKEHNQEITISL